MFAQAYLLWKRQSGGDGYENGDGGDGGYDDGDDGYYDSYGGSWWWSPVSMTRSAMASSLSNQTH